MKLRRAPPLLRYASSSLPQLSRPLAGLWFAGLERTFCRQFDSGLSP